MTVEAEIRAKKLLATLRATPQELYRGMRAASLDVGSRYRAYHRKMRLARIKTGRGIQSRPGPRAIAKTFDFQPYGNSLNTLHLKIFTRSPVAIQHEAGATLTPRGRRYMLVPMKAARDRWGRKTPKAKRLLAASKHVYQAGAAGFSLRAQGTKWIAGSARAGSRIGILTSRSMAAGLYAIKRQRDGKIFLVTKKRGSDTLVFWFHLIRSAQIKPTLDFRALWRPWSKQKGMAYYKTKVAYAIRAARKKGGAA